MTRKTSDRHTEILNAYKDGTSSFNSWMRDRLGDLHLLSWEWGAMEVRWHIDDRFIMPDGVMFGGHIASVADHVAGLLSMTVLENDKERFRTSRLETSFFRPLIKPESRIIGRITNVSRSLIHAEADFMNAESKLAARVCAVQVRQHAS